ncbi:MAG: hypothetical protein K8J31_00210 [Anaerolineae bacterium]|nr:hypothetical protein [Anaerolineae bacterium]
MRGTAPHLFWTHFFDKIGSIGLYARRGHTAVREKGGPLSNLHRPIVGASASRYVLIMVLAFATSVVATRLYLELTGYPQIGNETFHFAHALWGGLLQASALLLLFIFVNRWVKDLSAVLGGMGVGLFIDEVGKFITQQNDYFFPLAAPLIYVTFLTILMIYLVIKRRQRQRAADVRMVMYQVLDELEEVLEDDLSVSEQAAMVSRLRGIADQTTRPDLAELSRHILAFLQSDAVTVIPDRPSRVLLVLEQVKGLEDRFFSQRRMRRLLIVVFLLNGFATLFVLFVLISTLAGYGNSVPDLLTALVLDEANIRSATSLNWYLVMSALNVMTGLLLFVGALVFFLKRDSEAITLGMLALVITLTLINTLSFYFNQFSIVLNSIYSFLILLALQRYRNRFLDANHSLA